MYCVLQSLKLILLFQPWRLNTDYFITSLCLCVSIGVYWYLFVEPAWSADSGDLLGIWAVCWYLHLYRYQLRRRSDLLRSSQCPRNWKRGQSRGRSHTKVHNPSTGHFCYCRRGSGFHLCCQGQPHASLQMVIIFRSKVFFLSLLTTPS